MDQNIKIGIVGFSRNQFDKKEARLILEELFSELSKRHAKEEIEIVSGYTNSGVPQIAYEVADKYGFITVGYSSNQALKVRSGVYPVTKVILKGERFGDESEDFVKYIDKLIRIGGGKQSRDETEMFKELHKTEPIEAILREYEVEWYGEKPKIKK